MTKLIIIDGIIANGKTTLVNKLLAKHPDWVYIPESVPISKSDPINIFTKTADPLFVENLIQTNVYNAYVQALSKPNSIIIADRIFSASRSWSLFYYGKHTPYQQFLIEEIYKLLKGVEIDYVYLRDPTKDFTLIRANIKSRGREYEQHYTSEDLEKLESIYTDRYIYRDLEGLNCYYHSIGIGEGFYEHEVEIIEAMCNLKPLSINYENNYNRQEK